MPEFQEEINILNLMIKVEEVTQKKTIKLTFKYFFNLKFTLARFCLLMS